MHLIGPSEADPIRRATAGAEPVHLVQDALLQTTCSRTADQRRLRHPARLLGALLPLAGWLLMALQGHAGDSLFGLCWIDTQDGATTIDKVDASNAWLLAMFLVPVAGTCAVNAVCLVWVRRELDRRRKLGGPGTSDAEFG